MILVFVSCLLSFGQLTLPTENGVSPPCECGSVGEEFVILLAANQTATLEVFEVNGGKFNANLTFFPAVLGEGVRRDGKRRKLFAKSHFELPAYFRDVLVSPTLKPLRVYLRTSSEVSVSVKTEKFITKIFPVTVHSERYIVYVPRIRGETVENSSLILAPSWKGKRRRSPIEVSIKLSSPVVYTNISYKAGDTLTFLLRVHEIKQLTTSDGDFTGTIVASTKPLAVFADGHQLIPPSRWSTRFNLFGQVEPPEMDRARNYKIIASDDNTVVWMESRGTSKALHKAGESWDLFHSGTGLLESSKPIFVLEEMLGDNVDEHSLFMVPGEDHYPYSKQVRVLPSLTGSNNSQRSLNIIIKRSHAHVVRLQDVPYESGKEIPIKGSPYVLLRVHVLNSTGLERPAYFVDQVLHTDEEMPVSPMLVFMDSELLNPEMPYLRLPIFGIRKLTPDPFYLHELGGQELKLKLGCHVEPSPHDSPTCRYDTGEITPGNWKTGLEGSVVECLVPAFDTLGSHSVEVALTETAEFRYRAEIYVAPHKDFSSIEKVKVTQASGYLYTIDLAIEEPINITWPAEMFQTDTDLTVSLRLVDTANGCTWSRKLLLLTRNAANEGIYVFFPDQHFASRLRKMSPELNSMGQTVAFFSVSSPTSRLHSEIVMLHYFHNCSLWSPVLRSIPDDIKNMPSCPCTVEQAYSDARFFDDTTEATLFFHPEATRCFQAATFQQSGQQCCYDGEGMLLYGPPSGGNFQAASTLGEHSPVKHWWYDVLPWYSCCVFENECSRYYKHRSSDDCSSYEPPAPSAGIGSGHVVTPDGAAFTFNAEGEFIFLHINSSNDNEVTTQKPMFLMTPGTGDLLEGVSFALHARLVPKYDASVFTSLLFVTGEQKLQIDLVEEPQCGFKTFLNNQDVLAPVDFLTFPGMQLAIEENQRVTVAWEIGVAIRVVLGAASNPCSLAFTLQLDKKLMYRIRGLLGNFNGNPADDLRNPSDEIIPLNSSLADIHDFGLLWRIPSTQSVFKYVAPSTYYSYEGPDFQPTFPETNAASEMLARICGSSLFCRFDGMVLGENFAKVTLQQYQDFRHVMKVATKAVTCGTPPLIANGTLRGSGLIAGSTWQVSNNEISQIHTRSQAFM